MMVLRLEKDGQQIFLQNIWNRVLLVISKLVPCAQKNSGNYLLHSMRSFGDENSLAGTPRSHESKGRRG